MTPTTNKNDFRGNLAQATGTPGNPVNVHFHLVDGGALAKTAGWNAHATLFLQGTKVQCLKLRSQ